MDIHKLDIHRHPYPNIQNIFFISHEFVKIYVANI